jgi:hypothetical protein
MSGDPGPAIPPPPRSHDHTPSTARDSRSDITPGYRTAGAWPVMAEVPGGPVQAPPRGFIPPAEQAQILAAVLTGIELGAWDRQIMQWLAGLDACTVLTVASLIARARAAGPARSRR